MEQNIIIYRVDFTKSKSKQCVFILILKMLALDKFYINFIPFSVFSIILKFSLFEYFCNKTTTTPTTTNKQLLNHSKQINWSIYLYCEDEEQY